MKKFKILGGAGIIGINVSKLLLKKNNYKVTIADNLSRGKLDSYLTELLKNKNLDLVEGDFTKNETFDLLDKDYDYCYMLASVVGVNNTLQILTR